MDRHALERVAGVNYWERWIGDWKRKTAHLSVEEKGIYAELLDHLYATEQPLPSADVALKRICGIHEQREADALKRVLAEFFDLDQNGYTNKRAGEEIAKRRAYVDSQRGLANRRWAKAAEPAPQKPPRAVNGSTFHPPEWIDGEQWASWIKIRPAKARTEASQKAAVAKLAKLRAEGHDANEIVATSLANGWQGLFPPDGKRGGKPSLAEVNRKAADDAVRMIQSRGETYDQK